MAINAASVKLSPFWEYFVKIFHASLKIVLFTWIILSFLDDKMKFPISKAILGGLF